MKNILADAGPMIALFDRDDRFHQGVMNFLREFKGAIYSTWPVITEASHMLGFNVNVQIDFLTWLKREAVTVLHLGSEHIERIIELSKKYSDVPMDLADSSMILSAEMTGIHDIISIDSDYHIYRTRGKKALNNLLLPYIDT